MTKKEMIKLIQLQDAELFLTLKEFESKYGKDALITNAARARFSAVNCLMENLGIKGDFNLRASKDALELIIAYTDLDSVKVTNL
jgi:hypothetical protein